MADLSIEEIASLGLSKVQSRIYKDVIDHPVSTGNQIIKRTFLHKGTVYNSLRSLQNRGLLAVRVVNGTQLFVPATGYLDELQREQDEAFHHRMETIRKLKDILREKKKLKEYEPKIEMIIGDEGFKQFFNTMIRDCKKRREVYLFIGRGNEMVKHFGEEYYAWTQEFKKKQGVKTRAILSTASSKEPVMRHISANIGFIDWNLPSLASTWVFGDKVAIALWKHEPLIVVLITDRDVNRSYRAIFHELWDKAKKA